MLIECDTRAEQWTIHFCPSVLEGETGGVRSGSVCAGFAAPDESDENRPSWDAKG